MYKETLEKLPEVLNLFNSGLNLKEISSSLKIYTQTVKALLALGGIDYDEYRENDRKMRLEKAVEMYKQGFSNLQIQKELNLTGKTVRALNKEFRRSKSQQYVISHGNTINDKSFSELTPETLYWIGVLHSDGHITKTGNSIELILHEDDKELLEKFLNFVSSNKKPTKVKNSKCCRVRIGCEQIHKDLQSYGFTNRKTWVADPPDCLSKSADFWRGVIDGDGCYYERNDLVDKIQISLCGTEKTILKFSKFCSQILDKPFKIPVKSTKFRTENEKGNLHFVSYYSTEAVKIINELYKNSTPETRMDRKYNKIKQFIENN